MHFLHFPHFAHQYTSLIAADRCSQRYIAHALRPFAWDRSAAGDLRGFRCAPTRRSPLLSLHQQPRLTENEITSGGRLMASFRSVFAVLPGFRHAPTRRTATPTLHDAISPESNHSYHRTSFRSISEVRRDLHFVPDSLDFYASAKLAQKQLETPHSVWYWFRNSICSTQVVIHDSLSSRLLDSSILRFSSDLCSPFHASMVLPFHPVNGRCASRGRLHSAPFQRARAVPGSISPETCQSRANKAGSREGIARVPGTGRAFFHSTSLRCPCSAPLPTTVLHSRTMYELHSKFRTSFPLHVEVSIRLPVIPFMNDHLTTLYQDRTSSSGANYVCCSVAPPWSAEDSAALPSGQTTPSSLLNTHRSPAAHNRPTHPKA